jgi:alpha-L-fucosidase
MKGRIGGKAPVKDFVNDYIVPQCKEFIDRYDPDILWFDGEWDLPAEERKTPELVAYFYNRAHGRKEVAVNDRLGSETRAKHGDFFTSEFHDGNMSLTHKWEECRSIGQSYGYNRDDTEQDVVSSGELIWLLVDTVSQGGNLLLMVNLTGSGGIPEMYATRLKAMGEWLKVNGNAIYATRQAVTPREDDVRFTRSKDGKLVYAIRCAWPGASLRLKSVRAAEGSTVRMLGVAQPLSWRQDAEGLTIAIPEGLAARKPCEHAYVFQIETAP